MIKIKHVKKALQGGHDQLKKKGGGESSTVYFTLTTPCQRVVPILQTFENSKNRSVFKRNRTSHISNVNILRGNIH